MEKENLNILRNFVIISHIDHGKSTLADRLLEITSSVPKEKMRPQFLDRMDLEREKGITIKMKPVRMNYLKGGKNFHLNLIDTPGHIDFAYEVSRSLAAVEGAVLLVDATKGIQAQTLGNLELAKAQGLKIIPAVNKIDAENARISETLHDIAEMVSIPEDSVLQISGKTGANVRELLERVIDEVPPPVGETAKPFKALVFDSEYDVFKGAVVFVRVIDGEIKAGSEVYFMASKTRAKIKEIGHFLPQMEAREKLLAGEIGYIATGIKETTKARVGDTVIEPVMIQAGLEQLPGYREPKPMVFASVFPEDQEDYDLLKASLLKLQLNDAALSFEPESQQALGRGFQCGFLGTLHAEIVSERLQREFGLGLVISTPSVVFKISDKKGKEFVAYSASDWPDPMQIGQIQEPWVKLEVITPSEYLGRAMEVLESINAKAIGTKYFGASKVLIEYEAPLRSIITGVYDLLKGATQGFASMNYELIGYRDSDLVKVEILLAGEPEEAFSKIVAREDAQKEGRKIISKLKKVLPSQQFNVTLQASVLGKIIAREDISARRKDVTAPLYGGDVTRKRKLLERQKKGKEELRKKGQLRIPAKVFIDMFTSD